MKKILFLLLLSVAMYGQVPADATPLENIQITNNQTSTTATKVNVQENDGTINTKPLSELDNYLEFASAVNLPVTGEQGKLYLTKDNNRLYRFNGTIYQELADNNNVKLTGDQTIYDTKSFNNLSTSNSSIVIDANSGGGGRGAIQINNRAQNFGLRIDQSFGSSTSAGILIGNDNNSNGVLVDYLATTGNGRAYEGRNVGVTTFLVDNLGKVIGSKFIKYTAPANNILLAGGSDVAQNTAFNKPFGTTVGTVVEGGTLGTNAYSSTPYLPLTGGIINGSLTVQNSNYTTFSVKGTNTGNNGGGLIRFENQDTLFGEIAVETESAGNAVIYLRSLTNGVITQKASIASSGAATFSSTVTASPATLPNHVVVKSQLDAVANIVGTSGSYTPSLSNLTNISNSSFDSASYTKIGNVVTARVSLFITAVTPSVTAVLDFLLPVPRVSTNVTGIGLGSSFEASMVVNTNSNTTTARLSYQPLVSTNRQVVVMFQYIVD